MIGHTSLYVRKRTFWYVRPTKTQISLRIRAVWSESSLSAWRNFASLAIQKAPSEDSDQTARMRRLIRIFAGRTCLKVRFLTVRQVTASFYRHNQPRAELSSVDHEKLRREALGTNICEQRRSWSNCAWLRCLTMLSPWEQRSYISDSGDAKEDFGHCLLHTLFTWRHPVTRTLESVSMIGRLKGETLLQG